MPANSSGRAFDVSVLPRHAAARFEWLFPAYQCGSRVMALVTPRAPLLFGMATRGVFPVAMGHEQFPSECTSSEDASVTVPPRVTPGHLWCRKSCRRLMATFTGKNASEARGRSAAPEVRVCGLGEVPRLRDSTVVTVSPRQTSVVGTSTEPHSKSAAGDSP